MSRYIASNVTFSSKIEAHVCASKHRARPAVVVNSQLSSNAGSYPYHDPAIQLPGAVWLKKGNFRPHPTIVQGENFVMHRPGDAMLPPQQESVQMVPFISPQHTSLQRMHSSDATQLTLSAARRGTALVPVGISGTTAMISLAVTPSDDAPTDTMVYETNNTSSPRRTHKIKFTCRICSATNIKPINPHAWKSGSVFARCSGCNITHKLIDNLKLFHELSGPVFSPPVPEAIIPESLRLASGAVHEERPIDSLWLLEINPEIFGL